ncbi:MAG: fibrobacter succinogenes major paralogous domain-containing protein [Bacteroidales bacterium]|nr:fibrobacter succinogenes major paralogous domain-containing protein [Bacteroidales bacterium]
MSYTPTLTELSFPANITPKEKRSKKIRHSTFLTLNMQTLPLSKESRFFDVRNFAYGLKIGTMRNSGWYLSLMSNFWFPGTFRSGNSEQLANPLDIRNSYFEGMLGLTGRYWKPLSFHFGVGMNYRTTNYLCQDHVWRNQQKERGYGPVVASGFMFHISGFVLSAEAVAHYTIQEGTFMDNFFIGAKVGVGFCIADKKDRKEKKNATKNERRSESALTRSLIPITATPDRYDQTSKGPTLPDMVFTDNQKSDIPEPTPTPTTQEKQTPVVTQAPEKSATVNKTSDSQETAAETKDLPATAIAAEDLLKGGIFPEEEEEQDTLGVPTTEPKPCGKLKVSDADHNEYHTVAIGSQCWMAENLRSVTDPYGHKILQGRHADSNIAYRYCPGNDTATVRAYGYLYNWRAASGQTWFTQRNDSIKRGICPEGWHLPDSNEWNLLALYLASYDENVCGGTNEHIGKALAFTRVWRANDKACAVGNEPAANNASGFSALPAGNYHGIYTGFGLETGFWCNIPENTDRQIRTLRHDSETLHRDKPENASAAYSIRCVMD